MEKQLTEQPREPLEGICEECRWWERDASLGSPDLGICHRHAPRTQLIEVRRTKEPLTGKVNIEYQPSSNFPVTATTVWCGDHERKARLLAN